MAEYDLARFKARPALKQRLAEINKGVPGYLDQTLVILESMPDGHAVSKFFLNRVLNGRANAPLWLVIVLTRFANSNFEMTCEFAVAASGEWFAVEGGSNNE